MIFDTVVAQSERGRPYGPEQETVVWSGQEINKCFCHNITQLGTNEMGLIGLSILRKNTFLCVPAVAGQCLSNKSSGLAYKLSGILSHERRSLNVKLHHVRLL